MSQNHARVIIVVALPLLGGCGLGVSQIPEIWDREDKYSTASMESQIKQSIFCELHAGALIARDELDFDRSYGGRKVDTEDDIPFPNSWGAQVELTFTADEKSTLTPGISLRTPLPTETKYLTNGPERIGQSYSTGINFTLSSQNYRQDKFDYFYTAEEITRPTKRCDGPIKTIDSPSSSSPFVNASNLGVRDWVPNAIVVSQTRRTSRKATNGEGPPISSAGKINDSATYTNRFILVSSGNVNPVWNLVKIGTPTSSLFDLNRTRTHELLITIGHMVESDKKDKKKGASEPVSVGLSSAALNAHLASQIGNQVAAAIRGY